MSKSAPAKAHPAKAKSPKPYPFIACRPKSLPKELHLKAAKHACVINPANAPNPRGTNGLEVGRIAMITSRWWGAKGVHLGVTFLDTRDAQLKAKILSYMNKWGKYGNVSFQESAAGEVRIARTRGQGYWSYIGTDILQIPHNQPTMNLEAFSLATPDSEYDRVVCHETGHCLSGDTLIDCPRDLERHPLGIPVRDLVGTNPHVYAWKDGRLVVRQASRVWLSKKNADTVRVILKPGQGAKKSSKYLPPQEIVGTPDHLVLLADGKTWKPLDKLKAGDRLCSMYRQSNGERSRIQWTGGPERVREHAFVCEQVHGKRPDGHDAHHKDERKLNQSVENLEWKDEFQHHSDHSRGRRRSPEAVAATAASWRGRKHSAEARAKMSAAHKGKKLPSETKAKISASTKGRPQSPELVAKRTEAVRRFYANGGRSGMLGKSMRDIRKKKELAANHTVVSVEKWKTMDVYDMTVPGADSFVANGVVVHNSLGFPHEHCRAEVVAGIDPQKAVAYFLQMDGWDAETTTQQVLTPLDPSDLTAGPVDRTSIMCYQLPGSIMKDGRDVPGGLAIDDLDGRFCAQQYPLAVQPPPPPTMPGADGAAEVWLVDSAGKVIGKYKLSA